jgi:hypothetical protein
MNDHSNRPTIAESMRERSGKQCRERYMNHLDPTIKKSAWTEEEDHIVRTLHNRYGKKWSKFMEKLPGRSDNAIKNRYHIISRKGFKESTPPLQSLSSFDSLIFPSGQQENGSESFTYVPETAQFRLKKYMHAREALQRKIELLMLEEVEEEEAAMLEKNPVGTGNSSASLPVPQLSSNLPLPHKMATNRQIIDNIAQFKAMSVSENPSPLPPTPLSLELVTPVLMNLDATSNFDYETYLGATRNQNESDGNPDLYEEPCSPMQW